MKFMIPTSIDDYIFRQTLTRQVIEDMFNSSSGNIDVFDNIIIDFMGEPYKVDSIKKVDDKIVVMSFHGAAIPLKSLSLFDLTQIYQIWTINKSKKKLHT